MVGHTGDGVRHQAGDRLVAGLLGRVGAGQHHEAGAVVDARSVARSYGAILLEGRAHLRQGLHRGIGLDVLVGVENDLALARLHRDRHDLRLEATLGDRRRRTTLRFHRQGVLVLTGEAPLFRQVLGGDTHVTGTERVGQGRHHRVDHLGVAHTRAGAHRRCHVGAPRHHFDATADAEIAVPEHDRLRGGHDALQAGAAKTVDRHRHRLHRQAGLDRRNAGDIRESRLGRDAVADGHVVDLLRIGAGTGDRFLHHGSRQIGRFHPAQRTAERTDGGTHRAQNHNITICHLPSLR